ncbi:hypothetical protein SPAR_21397, partial [Streptomyces sparsogenes DSM 40356]
MSLPGADELFRTTGGTALQSSSPASSRRQTGGEARVPAPAADPDTAPDGAEGGPGERRATEGAEQPGTAEHSGREAGTRPDPVGDRRPAGGGERR